MPDEPFNSPKNAVPNPKLTPRRQIYGSTNIDKDTLSNELKGNGKVLTLPIARTYKRVEVREHDDWWLLVPYKEPWRFN